MICSKGLPAPLISIHAPRTGSDACPPSAAAPTVYFNPRSPHGERLGGKSGLISAGTISIHAPRTGSDGRPRKNPPTQRTISIHAPCMGSDSTATAWRFSIASFQSTLPARGATRLKVSQDALRHFNPRSLHGERLHRVYTDHQSLLFQSTLPARGATCLHCQMSAVGGFQSTLPARGATTPVLPPLAECIHFNPRSPHGERQFAIDFADKPMGFQSTLPARGATRLLFHRVDCAGFQSTLPARGATAMHGIETDSGELISIHAPRTGSDARRACAAG